MPHWIRLYGRLLRFLRPHLGPLLAAIVFMSGLAAFSSFSLALIVPFTEIVLSGKSVDELGRGPVGAVEQMLGGGAPTGGATEQRAEGAIERGLDLRARLKEGFYDAIRGRDRIDTLRRFALALLLVFVLKNLFWYAQSYLIVRVEQNVIRDIRDRVFRHSQSLSLDYFSHSHSGTLIAKVTSDIDLIKGAIANGIADLLRQSLLLIAYLLTVLFANWKLFLFAVLILPPNLWLIARLGQTLRRSTRVSQAKLGRLTAVMSETFSGMRIVKAFSLEEERARRFSAETQGYARTMIKMTRTGSLATPLTEILGVLVAAVILWFAGAAIAGEGGASGGFLLFIVGMLSMMQPIKALSQVNIKIQQGLGAAQRVFELLDTRPSVEDPASPVPLTRFERELRYEQVAFAYREGVPVLRGIDLTVHRGEVVALVGPSGGGKSTLVDLLPRFYDPTGGRITLDGGDLRGYRLHDLRGLIGLVTQETILFEGTIGQNILMGRPEATPSELEAAARAANAHDFIVQMPEGYDTWIGERGSMLSGGQRQRLAIARAILKNPAILIFDEATSALDSESEALVQEAIDRLLTGRTAIVIAHRLSTVRNASRIAVVADGAIVQVGRHEELLAEGGLYRRLHEMQFRDRDEADSGSADPGRAEAAIEEQAAN
ncbi:MAG: ABC transporter ATP-binding protein [Candidatus Eisenbacteria bacterium]|nr:ABC transporter ATP-binding protein [Candidatus Eisenbacteria bacterium]